MSLIFLVKNDVVVDCRLAAETVKQVGEEWVDVPHLTIGSTRVDGVWRRPDGNPYTDSDAQAVATQLTLWKRLNASEQRALRTLANTNSPVGDLALRVEGSMFTAVETESRNPETKQLIGAAIQLGIVADIDRARELLGDPGFSL